MVLQEPATSLNPVLRVGDQIAETLRWHLGLSAAAARRRSVELLQEVRLPEAASRARMYPHQLSGGMRQRVLLAAALACDPALLIADEPTTALDVTVQSEILALLDRLRRRRRMALLFITHDLALVPRLAEQVAVMEKGRIVEAGAAGAVLAAPRHDCTRGLLRSREQRAEGQYSGAAEPVLVARDLLVQWPLRSERWWAAPRFLRPVDDIDLDIGRAETLGLAGETGCGKTTLARALCDHLPLDGGRVEIAGVDLSQLSGAARRQARRKVQLVFQDPQASLNPRLTVAATLAEAVTAADPGADEAQTTSAIATLLEEVNLAGDFADRYPHEMSGGQRQRVAIARSLAAEPLVLVADEPTSSLDAVVADRLLRMLAEIQRRRGLALLLVSHDLALLGRYCSRIAVMYRGHLVEVLPTAVLPDGGRHPYTRRLLRATPTLDKGVPPAPAGQVVPALAERGPEYPTESAPESDLSPARGCPYRYRCELAKASCDEALPDLLDLGSGHLLRCPHS